MEGSPGSSPPPPRVAACSWPGTRRELVSLLRLVRGSPEAGDAWGGVWLAQGMPLPGTALLSWEPRSLPVPVARFGKGGRARLPCLHLAFVRCRGGSIWPCAASCPAGPRLRSGAASIRPAALSLERIALGKRVGGMLAVSRARCWEEGAEGEVPALALSCCANPGMFPPGELQRAALHAAEADGGPGVP